MCVCACYLQEAGGLVEGLHCAVADGQVAGVGVGDDDLQRGWVHVPHVDVRLLALAQAAHEHGPAEDTQRHRLPARTATVVCDSELC